MAKVKLSKNAMAKERTQLRLYEKLLPTLELKRAQLALELKKAKDAYEKTKAAVDELETRIGEDVAMLAHTAIKLEGLVTLKHVEIVEETVVGVRLPRLDSIECEIVPYSLLAKPVWIDILVTRLQDAAEQRLRVTVAAERVRRLEKAVRRITQRVNLFEKILIPTAKKNIKRIKIFLGDLEREAVVRAKQAKQHRLAEAEALAS